jgi:hypothetical protein
MPPQAASRSKKSTSAAKARRSGAPARRAGDASNGWSLWWPLLAGIVLTVAAVKIAEILPLMGPIGLLELKVLYPFPLLLQQPQLGLAESTVDHWSQIALYTQWVAYGLYASLAVHWMSRWKALLQLTAVHLLGFTVLWLLSSK